jgi:hypothetical protein
MVKIPEFNYVEHLITMVIKKYLTSVIITSDGGCGKTYLTLQTIKRFLHDDEYAYCSGHITPLSLFKLLYKHNNNLIVLDDIEEILQNDICIGLLKSAMGEVEGKRIVHYHTTSSAADDVPESFEFTGGIIILCNMIPKEHSLITKALLSRAAQYEIELTYLQKLRIMQEIIDDDSELSQKEKIEIKKAIKECISITMDQINLRAVEKMILFYKYGKKIADSTPDLYKQLFSATIKTDDRKVIVFDLMKKDWPVNKQMQYFTQMTGQSGRTFLRIKKVLKKDLVEMTK